jgi:hypothetical protein
MKAFQFEIIQQTESIDPSETLKIGGASTKQVHGVADPIGDEMLRVDEKPPSPEARGTASAA